MRVGNGADSFAPAGRFRFFLVLLFGLSACVTSHRVASPDGEPAVVDETTRGHTPGPFWELKQSPDSPPRMYFLGSVHAASSDMFPLPDVIEAAYERSDCLVLEVNLLAVDPEQTQALVARHGLLLGEETLEDLLPPDMLEQLREALARRDMSLQNVERMRPWMVATILEEAQLAELGYEFANGIDLYFLRRAEDKKVASLETFESQLAMLSTLPLQLELRFLQDMLDDPEERLRKTQLLMNAWQRGDETTLDGIIFEHVDDEPELAELYERLIFRRNVSMADELERLLEEPGTWFVVVGAGHFVGDRSVIAHLKKRGYDIRRIP
jgi:hypothetical protein